MDVFSEVADEVRRGSRVLLISFEFHENYSEAAAAFFGSSRHPRSFRELTKDVLKSQNYRSMLLPVLNIDHESRNISEQETFFKTTPLNPLHESDK